MSAVWPRVQGLDTENCSEIKRPIKMREKLIMARPFPAERIAERVSVDRDQEQPCLALEMLAKRFRHLGGGGEMDETIARIIRAAAIDTLPFGLAPGRCRANLVDPAH